ncbi:MAG: TonB-dependent receptor [Bryobacteraceae bacterium]
MRSLYLIPLSCALLTAQSPPSPDDKPSLDPVKTSVTVLGQVQAETPSNIAVLGAPELAKIPGVNLDDRLRMVPGFSLFRRASSLVANPTTQGVSLRGIGSSGASRTLVLWDGVPVNDPFGGWVFWTRLDPSQLERVEILRSASTSAFGDRAMGGAIALFSPSPEQKRATLSYEAGNQAQHLLTAGFAQPFDKFAISGGFRGYATSGYYIVPANIRGRADTQAGVDFVSPSLKFDYFGDKHNLYLKADILVEDRDNGTVLQRNSVNMGTISAHYSGGTVNNISLLGYHTRQEYHQSFSTILAGRNTERLTSLQTVPTDATGGAFLYRRAFHNANLLAGGDIVRVEGYSLETVIPTGFRQGGGSQLQHGVFAQANYTKGPAQFFAGLRHHFTGQDSRFLSPSAGLTAGRGPIRFRSSVYRSFRAPTLNELYREFRAGNAVTQANPNLRQETLFGVEAGVDIVGESRRAGVTFFRNSIDNIITNVTLSSTPAQIIRQRRNAAQALSRGLEFDARQRYGNFLGEISYLYADSRFTTGPRLPQIPRHQGSAQLSYVRGGTLLAGGIRTFAYQFDDDLNTRAFILPGYAALQVSIRQKVAKDISAIFSMENALDRTFYVAFSPTPNNGAPRLWRIGLRWR